MGTKESAEFRDSQMRAFISAQTTTFEQLNVEATTTAEEIIKELGMLKLRRVLPSGTHGSFSRCVDFC